jgi:hypothetical protein
MSSPRHFVRQIGPAVARAWFESRTAALPARTWSLQTTKLSAALGKYCVEDESSAATTVLADITRCAPFISDNGKTALDSVATDNALLIEELAKLSNQHERGIHLLVHHERLFREAEEVLFFDHFSEGNRGRSFVAPLGLSVRTAETYRRSFAEPIQGHFRRKDGSGQSCYVEVMERRHDATTQVTAYVQGLPNHTTEFQGRSFRRQAHTPAIEAAIVYNRETGETTTVANGGASVHQALMNAFQIHLLGCDPAHTEVAKRQYRLERLASPIRLEPLPELGVRSVRVRKLRLALAGDGYVTLEAPSGTSTQSVYDVGRRCFGNASPLPSPARVVQATISMTFEREVDASRARTINIELSLPNSSNLARLPNRYRAIAEQHVVQWGLLERDGSPT